MQFIRGFGLSLMVGLLMLFMACTAVAMCGPVVDTHSPPAVVAAVSSEAPQAQVEQSPRLVVAVERQCLPSDVVHNVNTANVRYDADALTRQRRQMTKRQQYADALTRARQPTAYPLRS